MLSALTSFKLYCAKPLLTGHLSASRFIGANRYNVGRATLAQDLDTEPIAAVDIGLADIPLAIVQRVIRVGTAAGGAVYRIPVVRSGIDRHSPTGLAVKEAGPPDGTSVS